MINFRNLFIVQLLVCLLAGDAIAASQKHLASRNYWHPFYRGQRLDYCNHTKTECGEPIANRYCKLMGYDYASQQIKANNIGLTNYLDARLRCKGWECSGFMTIVCSKNNPHKPPESYHYSKQKFPYPRYNHYRVDWCYDEHKGCGSRAAQSFCRRIGFMKEIAYAQEKSIHASQTIGSQKLCFGKQCNGFKYIVCSR